MAESELIQNMRAYSDRITLMIGFASAILFELQDSMDDRQAKSFKWFCNAIEAVVYRGEPLPPMDFE